MASFDNKEDVIVDNRNKFHVICTMCSCLILRAKDGYFVEKEITLPSAAVDPKIAKNAKKEATNDNKSNVTNANEVVKKEDIKDEEGDKDLEQLAQPEEIVKQHWVVDDIFTFENLGFSKTVNGLKYLACASCEFGPIGVHQPNDQKSYLSFSRITYKPS